MGAAKQEINELQHALGIYKLGGGGAYINVLTLPYCINNACTKVITFSIKTFRFFSIYTLLSWPVGMETKQKERKTERKKDRQKERKKERKKLRKKEIETSLFSGYTKTKSMSSLRTQAPLSEGFIIKKLFHCTW